MADDELQMEKLSLIDVSMEDDNLIPQFDLTPSNSSSPVSEVVNKDSRKNLLELYEFDVNGQDEDNNATDIGINREQSPPSNELSQTNRTRTRVQGSLRKSLAWDKAFFTNEGVLNHEELSLVNKTFKSPKQQLLPEIEEDLRTSMGSNSSLIGDLALHDLEGKLFEQKRPIYKKYEEVNQTHHLASSSNRAGRSKHSKIVIDKKQSVTTTRSRTGRINHEMDVVRSKASVKQRSTQKSKTSVTEKANSEKKVADASLQKASRFQAPTSIALKTFAVRNKDDLQKSSVKHQRQVPENKSPSPSVSFTKRISSVSKRVKDTLGKVLPANIVKASGHKNSSKKVQDDNHICGRYNSSSNSSAFVSSASAKVARCHSFTSFQRFAKPVSEIKTEDAYVFDSSENNCTSMTDDSSSIFHSCLSPESSLDGLPSVNTPTYSSKFVTNLLKPDTKNVACHSQVTSAIDVSSSAVSQPSEVGQRVELQKKLSAPGKLPLNYMHTAKNALSINTLTSDRQYHFGSSQSRTCGSKPSGLRMPSPKLGFFDTASATFARMPSTLYGKFTGLSPDKKLLSYSGIPVRPPRFLAGGQSRVHGYINPKPHGTHSIRPTVISGSPSFQTSSGHPLPHAPCLSSQLSLDTVCEKFIPSSPSQVFETGLKLRSIIPSGKPQQDTVSFDGCHTEVIGSENTKGVITADDNQSKQHLQSYSSHDVQCNSKGTMLTVHEESMSQLDISGVSSTLQDGSKSLICQDLFLKYSDTTTATTPVKASLQNAGISVQPDSQKESCTSNDNETGSYNMDNRKEQLLCEDQKESENETNSYVSGNLCLDLIPRAESVYSNSNEYGQKVGGLRVSQASDQNGHIDEFERNQTSNSVCNLSKNENIPSPRRPNGTLLDLSTTLSTTMDWPLSEDVSQVSEESNMKKQVSPVSSVLADISAQENCIREEHNSDSPLSKNWRRKFLHGSGDKKEDMENLVDASPVLKSGAVVQFDEEFINRS